MSTEQSNPPNVPSYGTGAQAPSPHRMLWIVIGVLICVNVCSLALLWFQNMRAHREMHGGAGSMDQMCGPECGPGEGPGRGPAGVPPQHRGGPAFDFIVHELELDAAQQDQFGSMRDQHQMAVRPLRDTLNDLRRRMYQQVQSADDSQRMEQLKHSAMLQMKIDSITLRHFQDLRKILHPKQMEKFDHIIAEVGSMVGGGPPPPHEGAGAPLPPPHDGPEFRPRDEMPPPGEGPHPGHERPRPRSRRD